MHKTVKKFNTETLYLSICDQSIDKETIIVLLFKYSKLVNIIALRLIFSSQIVNEFCRCTSQTY
jgi:hypothetical protein